MRGSIQPPPPLLTSSWLVAFFLLPFNDPAFISKSGFIYQPDILPLTSMYKADNPSSSKIESDQNSTDHPLEHHLSPLLRLLISWLVCVDIYQTKLLNSNSHAVLFYSIICRSAQLLLSHTPSSAFLLANHLSAISYHWDESCWCDCAVPSLVSSL